MAFLGNFLLRLVPRPRQKRWEVVHGSKTPSDVSWFQDQPRVSLALIAAAHIKKQGWIVDVGGGASSLVDHLWDDGYRNLTVLDVSSQALEHAQARLGKEAWKVDWVVGDITLWMPHRAYDLWHDRAVFPFLTGEKEHKAYKAVLERALRPDGQVVIATFSPDGPETYNGHPIRRRSPETLTEELGGGFRLVETASEERMSPAGLCQTLTYCHFMRRHR